MFNRLAGYLFEAAAYFIPSNAEAESQRLLKNLVDGYMVPERFYHDIVHADETAFDSRRLSLELGLSLESVLLLPVAAGYHDIIDPKAPNAVEDSAQKFYDDLTPWFKVWGVEAWLEPYANAIRDTDTHEATDLYGKILVDADLQRFKHPDNLYADMIRKEYAEHPDDVFNAGRVAILKKYRGREPFFYFEDDGPALENIDRQLAELGVEVDE